MTPEEPPAPPPPAPDKRAAGRTISSSTPTRTTDGEARPRLISSRPTGTPAAPAPEPLPSARAPARPLRRPCWRAAAPAARTTPHHVLRHPSAARRRPLRLRPLLRPRPLPRPRRPLSPLPGPCRLPLRARGCALRRPPCGSTPCSGARTRTRARPGRTCRGRERSGATGTPRRAGPTPAFESFGEAGTAPSAATAPDRAQWTADPTPAGHGRSTPLAARRTTRWQRLSRPHRRPTRPWGRASHRRPGRPGQQQLRQPSLQWRVRGSTLRRRTGRCATGSRPQRTPGAAPTATARPPAPAQPRRARAHAAHQLPALDRTGARGRGHCRARLNGARPRAQAESQCR